MTRALRLFALLSAFFVVAVRCSSGFPLPQAFGAPLPASSAASEACPASEHPADGDSLAPVASDDDSDDGADSLLAPAPLALTPLIHAEASTVVASAWVAQRALPSHASNLERPPRS